MKRNLLFVLIMLLGSTGFAQYTISGTVVNTSSVPQVGKTVWATPDSILNPPGSPSFVLTATTNSSGAYSITMPSTVSSGLIINVNTGNCTGRLTNTHTYAGVNFTSNFTICIAPPPPTVSGTVTLGTGTTPAPNAKVLLIRKYMDSGSVWKLKAIDSALTNSTGGYSMPKPTSFTDTTFVKAFLLPASSSYSSYLPTYYTSSLLWSSAAYLPTISSSSVTANIALIGGTNPGGPGFIGGDVTMGANKSTAVGDALPNRLILLTDGADNPIAYTYSDNFGKFSFPSVPYGSYKIFGDVFGKTTTPLSFTLSAANPSAPFIKFEERMASFNATMPPLGIGAVTNTALSIYPNPVKNSITISGLTANADVMIYSMTGQMIGQYSVDKTNNTINTSALTAGNYIIKLTSDKSVTNMKFTKE